MLLGQEDPLEEEWQPSPVFLPGESHGQKSLAGYSPWGRKESDTTEQLNSNESECNQDFPGGSEVKNLPANAGDAGSIPGSGRSPGGGMATHSSIFAWEIPWTEEPGGLQSMGSQKNQTQTTTNSTLTQAQEIYSNEKLPGEVSFIHPLLHSPI